MALSKKLPSKSLPALAHAAEQRIAHLEELVGVLLDRILALEGEPTLQPGFDVNDDGSPKR